MNDCDGFEVGRCDGEVDSEGDTLELKLGSDVGVAEVEGTELG